MEETTANQTPPAEASDPASPSLDGTSTALTYDGSAEDAAARAILTQSSPVEPAPDAAPADAAPAAETSPPAAGSSPSPADQFGQSTPFGSATQQEQQLPPEDQRLIRALQTIRDQERQLIEARRNDGFANDEERALAKRLLEARKQVTTNPEVWFREAGWTQETLHQYIASGGKSVPLAPALDEVKGQFQTVQQELAALKQELAQSRQEAQEVQFKASIPQYIQAKATDFPYLSGYFDSPTEAAEQVWAVIKHAHTHEKRSLSVAEAAASIERVLSGSAERFGRVKKPTTTQSAPATTSKTPSPTLTNQAVTTSKANEDPTEDWRDLDRKALQALNSAFKSQPAN